MTRIFLHGTSMEPALKTGWVDIHFFKKGEEKGLKVGDIVSYKSTGFDRDGNPSFWHRGNCVHRVVGLYLDNKYALIKGDNRNYSEMVPLKRITGRIEMKS